MPNSFLTPHQKLGFIYDRIFPMPIRSGYRDPIPDEDYLREILADLSSYYNLPDPSLNCDSLTKPS